MTDITPTTIANFFGRYRERQRQLETAELDTFQSHFTRFTKEYLTVKEAVLKQARFEAPTFNIFRILGLSEYEVRTHSAFLAHLLNPAANHGQQHLFLRTFLKHCHTVHPVFPIPGDDLMASRWYIRTEINTVQGNLDIVVRSPELSYLCVIENKIYAVEQQNQLQRYAAWMATQAKDYAHQALIYLTPAGIPALTAGDALYFCLSYRENITAWLEQALDQIMAPSVRGVVAQYIEVIRRL